jgi:ATP/maltotriose-dependent transcriptional regulator MalT
MKRRPEAVGRFRPAVLTAHELVRNRLLAPVTGENDLGAAHCTLIVGPAGFGKTTLLAQAYRQSLARGEPTIWLECNQHDCDPSQLLHSLYTAASAAGAEMADPEFTTADFGRRVGSLGSNVCLCIDALEHVIATDAELLIERLLNCLPERSRVLLASRRLPNAWFLERELQGLADKIDAADLRLTCAELAELLPERFSSEQILKVATLTEGWPVAAQLTRLRAGDSASISEMLDRLAHEGLGLFEYLAHKVLEVLSIEQRAFLRITSILSAITPGLANALMQRDDGYALMSSMLRLAPIVSVTSDRDFTIRLHPLLRQYMRTELALQGQEYERGLHRRAAEALAATGNILEAVQHALSADDLRLAVSEFDRAGGEELIFTLGPPQVQTLISALPSTARSLCVRLQFTDFLFALIGGQTRLMYEIRKQFSGALREFPASAVDDPGRDWREFAAAYVEACADLLADLHEGAAPEAIRRCVAVERLAHLHFSRNEAYLGLILAIEVLLFSRLTTTAESRRALNEYVALCERNHYSPHLPSVNPQRGWLAFLEGDLDVALGFLARPQLKRTDRFQEPELLLAQVSKVLVATIHYERNEIEQAHAIIDSVAIDPDRTMPESWALYCRVQISCLEVLGRALEADHFLEVQEGLALRRDAPRLRLLLRAMKLELSVRRSQPDTTGIDALVHALEHELAQTEGSWIVTMSLGRAVIPALTLSGQHDHARRLAEGLVERAESCGHQLFRATGRILLAHAQDAAGDASSARSQLGAALRSTCGMRVVRPYIDIWAAKANMHLVRSIAEQTSAEVVEHIRALLRVLDAAVPQSLEGWSSLSERERDVLSALSAHTTTKAVAKTLGLSPETVKHHLKKIFNKLGVHSRTEALERLAQLTD